MPRDTFLITSLDIRGTKFPVQVDATGEFYADFEGVGVSATTLDGLRTKLGELSRKTMPKLSIPVCRVDPAGKDGIQRGTLTGKHAANDTYLVTWENGKKEQIRAYSAQELLDPERLGEDGIRELLQVREEIDKRNQRARQLIDLGRFTDLRQRVEGGAGVAS